MTDPKKKSTKKVEKFDDELKAVKKPKVKEIKETSVMQEIEEELMDTEISVVNLDDEAEAPEVAAVFEAEEPLAESAEKEIIAEAEVEPVLEEVLDIRGAKESKGKPSPEDFDWESFEVDELKNSPRHKEYEAMYDKTLSTVAVDEVVHGTVIQMTPREVVINIGYKSEGVVSLNEFRYNPNLKVGDTVEVYVESQEDKKGQLLLSHKKARAINSWDRVNASLEKDEIINGYIKCRTKGGMIVDVFGIEAFLPSSQTGVKPIRYDGV